MSATTTEEYEADTDTDIMNALLDLGERVAALPGVDADAVALATVAAIADHTGINLIGTEDPSLPRLGAALRRMQETPKAQA